jgi:seryl-tRNA synthetase
MDVFMVLQFFFDGVLLFAIIFLFNYSITQTHKKKEDLDILKNMQVQEIKENLQELLLTLRQLGKEVSDNIQEQVREAETKTELFKKVLGKLQKDLKKTLELAEEVNDEKNQLENKMSVIRMGRKSSVKVERPQIEKLHSVDLREKNKRPETEQDKIVGFSSQVVREVYRLADEELELNEIVRQTKLNRAEVQLILNLRGNRYSTPN